MPLDLTDLEERLTGLLSGNDLLAIYLRDHLAGSTFGVELARRARDRQAGTELGEFLSDLADEIEEDRAALQKLMGELGVSPDRIKNTVLWTAEKVGRLKLNGRLVSSSPLSPVVELEGLITGVNGKLALWQALREIADRDERLDPAALDELAARAAVQETRLREHQREAARAAFGG
jgi:hypothetical protein